MLKQIGMALALSAACFLSAAPSPAASAPKSSVTGKAAKDMRGKQHTTQTEGFGALPQGLDATAFIRWIGPDEDPMLNTLSGAKAWGADTLYIGAACFAPDAKEAEYSRQSKTSDCSSSYGWGAKKLYLGLFTWQDHIMQPVARTPGPLAVIVSWENSNLDSPVMVDSGEAALPQSYTKLDLAPYIIKPGTKAFGVRARFSEGYSGGGAEFEALQLFMSKGGQIVNIFSEPMSFYKDLAGEWNKDGTRERDASEGKNILQILSTQTDGYYDLQIKSLDSKWTRTFVWSAKAERYMAQPEKK